MPRGDQVSRLYELVRALAASKYGLPAAELARRHHWSPRNVYRDLHALEQAGFPVTRVDGARWKLIDGWQERVPFPLPLGQLLGLHVARGLMKPLRGSRLARDFDGLFERLTGIKADGSTSQGELFPRLRAAISARSQIAIDYTKHSAVLETLCVACERRQTVRAVYYAESKGETTRRRIDPYAVYFDPQLEALYVFAWCHLRKAMRTFAVHRFRQASLTDRHFEMPAGFSVESYLSGAFRIWREENVARVRLAIDRGSAGWVSERTWHASQKVRKRLGGGCEIEFTLDGVREITRFVLGLGAAVEVVEPRWLREEIAAEHRAAAERGEAVFEDFLSPDDTGLGEIRRR